MTLKNPNFLVAGVGAGDASGWHVSTQATYDLRAGFERVRYPGQRVAVESFDWQTLSTTFAMGELVVAIFEGRVRGTGEYFEEGWQPDVYLFELPEAALETVAFSSVVAESFNENWNLADYSLTWLPGRAQSALWDGTDDLEVFEGSWVAGYATGVSQVNTERAVFWGRQDVEQFDQRVWPDPVTP